MMNSEDQTLPYERDELKVRVVAHEGLIIIIPFEPEQDIKHEWWPTGGRGGNSTGGCVLGDSKKMLGVSEEALTLMQSVERNHDDLGDLGWWKCTDGSYAFSWWGPIFRIVNPDDAEGDREFRIHPDQCQIIPNDVPQEAIEAIKKDKKAVSWKEPESVEYEGP